MQRCRAGGISTCSPIPRCFWALRLSSSQGWCICTAPQGLRDATGCRPRFQTVHSRSLLLLAASGQSYSLTFIHPRLYSTQLPRSGVGIFCPSQTKFFIFLSVCGSIPQFPIFIIEITWPNPERSTLGDCKLSNPSTWDMLLQQHGSYRNAVH